MPSSPKSIYSRGQPASRRSTAVIFSRCGLVIGIVGFVFGLTSFIVYNPSRCFNSMEPRSVRVVWDQTASSGSSESFVSGDQRKKRHKVMGFVGIQTGFGSAGRRRSLRMTWMPSDRDGLQRLEESTGLAFRFVIGRTGDQSKMSELKKELVLYDDFLLLDIEEQYS